jgi:hypothetical protein
MRLESQVCFVIHFFYFTNDYLQVPQPQPHALQQPHDMTTFDHIHHHLAPTATYHLDASTATTYETRTGPTNHHLPPTTSMHPPPPDTYHHRRLRNTNATMTTANKKAQNTWFDVF